MTQHLSNENFANNQRAKRGQAPLPIRGRTMCVLVWTTAPPGFVVDIPKGCVLMHPTDDNGLVSTPNKSHCVVHLSELMSHTKLRVSTERPDLWRVTFIKYHEPDGWQDLGKQI